MQLLVPMLVVLAGACSRGTTPVVLDGDPELVAGRDIFIRNCTNCHGAAGNGGRGPRLSEGRVIENYPDVLDQIEIVADGKSGMPAFSGRLDAAEIEQVVRFTREVL